MQPDLYKGQWMVQVDGTVWGPKGKSIRLREYFLGRVVNGFRHQVGRRLVCVKCVGIIVQPLRGTSTLV